MNRKFVHQAVSRGSWVPSWLRYQQQTRYEWASESVADKRVVEVGCGSGLGCAQFLRAGAREVWGLDVDAEAIEFANQHHSLAGLHFDVMSDLTLPLEDYSIDLVIALETIEHVDEARSWVAELARVLRDDGMLILSTPNRLATNPGTSLDDSPQNRLHVREYAREELQELLSEHFYQFNWFGQTFFAPSTHCLLSAFGRLSPLLVVRLRQIIRLVSSPLDSAQRHAPVPWLSKGQPEVQLVHCQKKRLTQNMNSDAS